MLSHLFQRTSKALPSWLSTAWKFSQKHSCLCIFGAVRLSSIFLQLRFVWWIYLQQFVFLQNLKIGGWTLRKSHQQPAGGFQRAGREWDEKGFRGLCQGTVLPQGRSLSEVWNISPPNGTIEDEAGFLSSDIILTTLSTMKTKADWVDWGIKGTWGWPDLLLPSRSSPQCYQSV